MSTYFADIQGALRTHLSIMPNLPPLSLENIEFDNPAKTLFLRADFLPSETVQACASRTGLDEHNGIMQISIFIPKHTGRSEWPDLIADHFLRGEDLTLNSINVTIQTVSIEPGQVEPNYYMVPVSIRYNAFTPART